MVVTDDSGRIDVRRRASDAVHITVDATMMMVVRRSVSVGQSKHKVDISQTRAEREKV